MFHLLKIKVLESPGKVLILCSSKVGNPVQSMPDSRMFHNFPITYDGSWLDGILAVEDLDVIVCLN